MIEMQGSEKGAWQDFNVEKLHFLFIIIIIIVSDFIGKISPNNMTFRK